MNRKFYFILVLVLTQFVSTNAQRIYGKVTSSDGEPVPFASIYIKELTTGTTTNLDGEYSYILKPGSYNVSYQALGYQRQVHSIHISNQDVLEDVVLISHEYLIKEVKVYSGKEDPAYAIMRKAISMAPYFLKQVKHYKANVYLKGGIDMKKVPFLFRKSLREEGIEAGKSFVAESVNEIEFDEPDKYTHKQISKHTTFPDDNQDQVMNYINYSFYNSDDDLISPLSYKAFSFYKFRYEGFFEQDGYFVNKIQVIPKRNSRNLFKGYIYIVDKYWNLQSVDLSNEQFFGTIRIRQVQEPVKGHAWLPVSHNFKVDVSVMGFKLDANYAGSVKYDSIVVNEDLPVPKVLQKVYDEESVLSETESDSVPKSKTEAKIDEILNKENLRTRDVVKLGRLMEKDSRKKEEEEHGFELKDPQENYKIVKDTVKRDTVNWKMIRPIPLSANELKSFETKDSLKLAKTEEKTDTTKTKKKKSRFSKITSSALYGKTFFIGDSSITIKYNGLLEINQLGFNTVDGWYYGQSLNFRKEIDSTHVLTMRPDIGYAIDRKALTWEFQSEYTLMPLRRASVALKAGQTSKDFNTEYGIAPILNMASSLWFKDNYMKLFEDNFVELSGNMDIANGLVLKAGVDYHRFKRLENSTNYSFGYPNKPYRLNNYISDNFPEEAFNSQNSFSLDAQLSYTPKYYYRIKNGKKEMVNSDYPTITLKYKGGFSGIMESDARFDRVELGIDQKKEWSFMYAFDWMVNAGYHLNNNKMHFSEYKHFNTNEIPFSFKDIKRSFNLLNDYEYSTNKWFVEAHITYTTPYLLIKNLPFLQNKLWTENIYVNYLTQPQFRNYNEIGYGISQIFLMGTVGVFAGFKDGEYTNWGVNLSFILPE